MEKGYKRTRIIALISAIVFASSMVLSGCSVKKITKKEVNKTTVDDAVVIGEGGEELAEGEEIVVGEDDKTYVSNPNVNTTRIYTTRAKTTTTAKKGGTTTTTRSTSSSRNNNTPTNPTPSKTTTTTVKMELPMEEVYNRLAIQRKFGFNKAYDKFAGIANFFLDTITAYFEYDDKYWLIEFWKGEYAIGAVGCEIGFYTASHNAVNDLAYTNGGPEWIVYGSVEDSDAMKVTMKMWQYKSPDNLTTPVQKINYNIDQPHWWAADFATGTLDHNYDRKDLVMVGSIQFPNATIKNLFVNAMKAKGFTEGTINAYHNVETLQVEGNKVTVCWKNYADNYQVSKNS